MKNDYKFNDLKRNFFMETLINGAKFFLVLGLILTTINCGSAAQSKCELTKADGENILGITVAAIDKSNPMFGSKNQNTKRVRACGFVAEEPTSRGYLDWFEVKAENGPEAERAFEAAEVHKPTDATNYSTEQIRQIGDQARLIRYETKRTQELQMAVRKGKIIFLITVSKPLASEISVEQVKSLAKRLAAKIGDY